ncbi:MAG: T9SS type A sorting domain-containing protein [Flavobacteriales bacterium]|nr:T9SS type A sorting domain-containing protein [Flavobacteriales bacterium]
MIRIFFVFFLCFVFAFSSYAHKGDVLIIHEIKITQTEKDWFYHYELINMHNIGLHDVKVEFILNGKKIIHNYYCDIKSNEKFTKGHFKIPKSILQLEEDHIQIEISEISGKRGDWAKWDSKNNPKQVNTLFSEFFVDAPWRMKKKDNNGNIQPIPLNFFLHDADLVVGTSIELDHIDVQLKNASSTNWNNVLVFDTISESEYHSLFGCFSNTDSDLSVQEFDLTSFTANSSHTIDFDAESGFFGGDYVTVDAAYYYFTLNIPEYILQGFENTIDIRVLLVYNNTIFSDEEFGLRVFRSDEDIPKQPKWYRGDTHLHTMYTENSAEFGLPLCSTKEAAKLIGIDWITCTDHTSDYDNYGDENVQNNWNKIQTEAQFWNSQDSTMIYIPGQEVAVNNSNDNLVHMLAYPDFNAPMSLPFLGDGDGDVSSTNVSIDMALENLANANGFAYAAHPFATEDKLPVIPVDGGIWNLGESGFPLNGDNFPKTGGSIIANNLSLSSDVLSSQEGMLLKEALVGGQIWNCRSNLNVSGINGNESDGWDVLNGSSPFSQVDTASYGYHIKKFRQGQELVNYINQMGLSKKNQDSSYQNWKMYYAGGSDAHGSFNFSNTGNFAGFGGVDDNALGKISTLVYCPNGQGENGTNLLKALQNGNSTISDGPILTMGLSTDGNNNSNEVILGADVELNSLNQNSYFLNLNYTSTNEFGDVVYLKLILGTESGETSYRLLLDSINGNQNISYSLNDVIEEAIGIDNVLYDEYFYLRAELQTFKDYSLLSDLYRTDYGFFHSFTNPIWIKINEIEPSTSFELILSPNPWIVNTENINLTIKCPGENNITIEFYNSIGQILKSEIHFVNEQRAITYSLNDLKSFSEGIYFIKASTVSETVSTKLIRL